MAHTTPHVFNIPSGIPFARALTRGVIARAGDDPLTLADTLVFVPTRRAARSLREAFADALGGAALLPRIVALGDVGEENDPFASDTGDLASSPPISPLRRRLLLSVLVQRWGEAKRASIPFTQALAYAGELGSFLDEAITHRVDLAKIKTLAPDWLAAHWQDVAQFLAIVGEQWPIMLKEQDAVEAAAYRDAKLHALAAQLAANPPRAPVIAAGSTGSIPATAALLKTVAELPTGAVVLPGLDTVLDDRAWQSLEPAHAQFGLRQLLDYLDIGRDDVAAWSPLPERDDALKHRVHFLSEALRPPPTTDAWRDLLDKQRDIVSGLSGVALVEAQTSREEALVIACALRQAVETPGRTAALVTPDRALARRVAAEMARWNVEIDDSAGQPLTRTPPGAFLALLARAAAERFAPVPLLALLKHPLASGGEERASFRHNVRALELRALRGLRPEPGLDGIAERLTNAKAPFDLQNWFSRLARKLAPFAECISAKETSLEVLAEAHAAAAELLAATNTESGKEILWRGQAGEAAADLIAALMGESSDVSLAPAQQYSEVFRTLAAMRAVRPLYNLHPRLAILGPLEARLLDFDLVILSGLNEGQWPADAATDPWLSRQMREELGLEAPERRLGLAAHDFASLAASRQVLLTRSLKENGAPTVASRWLLRIKQLAKGLSAESALDAQKYLLRWARMIDSGPSDPRVPRAAPCPPVTARPRSLSITEIETWLRDPYAIYGKHILRLKPVDPLDEEPGPPERGTAIHGALEAFLRAYPNALPMHAFDELLRFGDEAFAKAGATDAVLALWRPRFARAARWFLAYERERRAAITQTLVEMKGTLEIAAREAFTLRGRADRIDFFADGSASILDYKTGRVPSDKQIKQLLSPQLPLEGAMLMMGAFGEARARAVRDFVHIQLTGGEPPGRECVADVDADSKAMEALAKLTAHVARYDDPLQPYRSREMPYRLSDVGDYDHLARVREWTLEREDDE